MRNVDDHYEDPLKTFLGMIVVQMLPLAALEMKIMSCADPVGLFCKFSMPVTLLHGLFLGMRLVMYRQYDSETLCMACIGFVGALVTIMKGFRQSLLKIVGCYNVWSLIIFSIMAAYATEGFDSYMNRPSIWQKKSWSKFNAAVFQTSNNYIELTAFVPAVLMVFRENTNGARYEVESTDTKRVSTAFFLFLVGFYIMEDLGNAYLAYEISVLASIGHVAHFALLLDFACYVLAHIYNPDKLVGELRRWLPVDFSHEV
jgi:hypothetical protein